MDADIIQKRLDIIYNLAGQRPYYIGHCTPQVEYDRLCALLNESAETIWETDKMMEAVKRVKHTRDSDIHDWHVEILHAIDENESELRGRFH